jgi:O-antigen/teichoic acid export membrane protein
MICDAQQKMVKRLFLSSFSNHRVILTNAGSLVGTQVVTSGLGFLFWWLAARLYAPQAVGFASAAISGMMLLGALGILGFGTLLIGELPRQKGGEAPIISAALIVVALVGMGLGVLFARLAPWISKDLQALNQNAVYMLLFASGVCLTAVILVVDQSLIGMLRGDLQLLRNIIFASVKLAALFLVGVWFANQQGLSIYTTWLFGNLVSLLVLLGIAISKRGLTRDYLPQWSWLRNFSGPALSHHGLNLTLQAPPLILPLIVTAILSAEMNAYFYTAWMIASFVFVAPIALTTVLYAIGSADPDALGQKIRMTLAISLGFGLLANIFLLAGAGLILGLFGPNYAAEASWSLRILAIAVFPVTIRIHYVAICRIFRRINRAALWMAAGGILELTLASLGAITYGLPGLCMGWLFAVCVEAAFMLPTVYRTARAQDLPAWQSVSEEKVPIANG